MDEWKSLIDYECIQQYLDFALTKFYLPFEDIGLVYSWEILDKRLCNDFKSTISPLLGETISSFDPGKMSSYFQSKEQVIKNLNITSFRSSIRSLRE